MPLKSRTGFPPYGWKYRQPETGWQAPSPMSENFDRTVNRIIAHRLANPRFPFATDYNTVTDELDAFTCTRLKHDPYYCDGPESDKKKDGPQHPPQGKPMFPSLQRLRQNLAGLVENIKRSAAGARILGEWIGQGGKPVAPELAERRATICVSCPMNTMDSHWLFGLPKTIAIAIHEQRRVKSQLELKVSVEDKLGTCDACKCQNQLAVWVPIHHIRKQTSRDIASKLDPRCWKLKEP